MRSFSNEQNTQVLNIEYKKYSCSSPVIFVGDPLSLLK